MTAEEHAAVAISHRPGITVQAGPGCKRAFEIGAPYLVGRGHDRGRLAGVADVSRVSLLRAQAMAAPNVTDRGAPGKRPTRMTCMQDRQLLLSAPRWWPRRCVEASDAGGSPGGARDPQDLADRMKWRNRVIVAVTLIAFAAG